MKEKFTPGPWEIIGQFEDRIYHEPSDTVVAQAWYPGASNKSPSPADTMKANARLIAAAPDMYEALKEIARADTIAHSTGKYSLVVESCAESARAALAKADGTQ